MNPIHTDVAIIGAGPAGLVLARMLQLQGIDAVVLERRSRAYVLGRVRAGIIEQPVAELLVELGVGERMLAERLVHDGVQLQHRAGDRMVRHRIDFGALTAKSVTVYGQRELVRDLIERREADGLPLRFGAEVTGVTGLDDDRVSIRCRDEAGETTITARYVAGVDGAHGVTARLLDAEDRQTLQRSYPASWLGVLVAAAPPSHELIYARHPAGFALASMRTPEISRLYLQVPAGDTLADWSEDRIWEQLHRRLDLPDSPVKRGTVPGIVGHPAAQRRPSPDAFRPAVPGRGRRPRRPAERSQGAQPGGGRHGAAVPRAGAGAAARRRERPRRLPGTVPAPGLAGDAFLLVDDGPAAPPGRRRVR